MKVVSNASPLITLARTGYLDRLPHLFDSVLISNEVHREIVVDGAGMPGASAISATPWIRVSTLPDNAALVDSIAATGLGAGETSTVLLARHLGAELVLMDERKGRRFATQQGLRVAGCVGLLEQLFRKGHIPSLRDAYRKLLDQEMRIDRATLRASLLHFGLPGL